MKSDFIKRIKKELANMYELKNQCQINCIAFFFEMTKIMSFIKFKRLNFLNSDNEILVCRVISVFDQKILVRSYLSSL